MKIFGAGLAGLIAGCVFPKAHLYEKNERGTVTHQALLRFRTDKISEITGIHFKKVNVLKAIWSEGKEVLPSPRVVAMYSKKVTGKLENRSIMDISTKERYIAPANFHELLVEDMEDRIHFGWTVSNFEYETETPIISTLPLSFNSKMLGYNFETQRSTSSIYVNQFIIEDCDMYSTVYYPDMDTSIYRASITGNVLIIESKEKINEPIEGAMIGNKMEDYIKFEVFDSFGLYNVNAEHVLKNHKQTMGKLTKINDSERRVQIYNMSHNHDVYSLGRFALHKNILLDDVAKDIYVIKSMINDDSYGISTRNRI